ncbi:MAG: hypothetical protein CUN55_08385 [Phototrophicales bacterium]|nr:MAG: hypothetical protein CUN55_08385 [Phototrophicales bacterium]
MSLLRINGMIDPHVHLRDLDWEHKGTFTSETAAAIAGGYWAVLDMPNTMPSTIDSSTLAMKKNTIRNKALSDWGLYFGAAASDNTEFYRSIWGSVCGIKIYNNATTGNLLIEEQALREKIYQAWHCKRPIAVHAEGETVAQILELVKKYRRFTHFTHISTAEEIHYLRQAKADGLPISIGVTPHHLYLTEDDIPSLGSLGLMKPELKTKHDQAALWQAIAEGLVDVIESDHAPHTLEEKMSDSPPYGVPGLETTLSLMLLAVREERLSLEQLIPMISENPRSIFGIKCPPDTYTLVDINISHTIRNDELFTQCGWTPFNGMQVMGRVREVWIRGVQVFDGEQILVEAGFGQNIIAM